ncbi:MAG: hypothetical protein FJZ01_03625 [Candidatus Sericytochromatia bacterium]|nr:hypothetical protein [Candidatus Tanganyikabacteria bacterium]
MRSKRAKAIGAALLAVAMVSLSAGCGDNPTLPGQGAAEGAAAAPAPAAPKKSQASEPVPSGPQTADPGSVPTNIPKPIPTPDPPTKAGEIKVKATAYSVTSNPLSPWGKQNRLINIHVDLRWTLPQGAVAYRISRNGDGGDQFTIRQTINANSIVKSLPLYWREYSIPGVNQLTPGNKYKYLVEALNTSNKVIASGVDETAPLYPLDVPNLIAPENNAKGTGIQPAFQWSRVNNADGYFVEVFAGSNFLPQWRGFRAGQEAITMKYGELGDGYPGLMPAVWTMVLQPNVPYTWTVTAYKTDTGNAATAKAFAESNATSFLFTP